MYLNQATIIGNLTRDVELKSLPSGMSVASFSVATNKVWKDKNGAKQESVEYHNIVVFGKTAETCAQWLSKGQQVLIIGRIQTRSWDTDQGKKYRTEIIADTVQFGNRPNRDGNAHAEPHDTRSQADKDFDSYGKKEDTVDFPTDEINPEDIPF